MAETEMMCSRWNISPKLLVVGFVIWVIQRNQGVDSATTTPTSAQSGPTNATSSLLIMSDNTGCTGPDCLLPSGFGLSPYPHRNSDTAKENPNYCTDWQGTEIAQNQYFTPMHGDPCLQCKCDAALFWQYDRATHTLQSMRNWLTANLTCLTASCAAPNCTGTSRTIPGKCCEFACVEDHNQDGDTQSFPIAEESCSTLCSENELGWGGACARPEQVEMHLQHLEQEHNRTFMQHVVERVLSYGQFGDGHVCVCKKGFTGAQCNIRCSNGTYGHYCLNKCPENCRGGRCNPRNGNCRCRLGHKGMDCSEVEDKCRKRCPQMHGKCTTSFEDESTEEHDETTETQQGENGEMHEDHSDGSGEMVDSDHADKNETEEGIESRLRGKTWKKYEKKMKKLLKCMCREGRSGKYCDKEKIVPKMGFETLTGQFALVNNGKGAKLSEIQEDVYKNLEQEIVQKLKKGIKQIRRSGLLNKNLPKSWRKHQKRTAHFLKICDGCFSVQAIKGADAITKLFEQLQQDYIQVDYTIKFPHRLSKQGSLTDLMAETLEYMYNHEQFENLPGWNVYTGQNQADFQSSLAFLKRYISSEKVAPSVPLIEKTDFGSADGNEEDDSVFYSLVGLTGGFVLLLLFLLVVILLMKKKKDGEGGVEDVRMQPSTVDDQLQDDTGGKEETRTRDKKLEEEDASRMGKAERSWWEDETVVHIRTDSNVEVGWKEAGESELNTTVDVERNGGNEEETEAIDTKV